MSPESMNCERFQLDLPDLLYGEMPPEASQAAESHAEGCPECAALLAELKGVKGALPSVTPPAALGTRLKLMARDELLSTAPREQKAEIGAAGGPLHLAAVGLLAACLIGFGLGIAFQRRQADRLPPPPPTPSVAFSPTPALPIPRDPDELPEGPGVIEATDPTPPVAVPRRGAAWQRVMYDAGYARLQQGKLEDARTFLLRAAAVDPEGALAAAAEVGAAEALLRQGRREDALAELEAVRRAILAGKRYATGSVLQRIAELVSEAEAE
ncbi:MAG TPA: hypothetical protein DEA08_31225 [Planctomycetes bacterium]|nr:hypothetical protein [Planctomycetota bacterium]